VTLVELLAALPEAELSGPKPAGQATRVTHDSRTVRSGDVFVAIRGEKADGQAFAGEAVWRGAGAVVSDRPAPPELASAVPWALVPAPRRALGNLAAILAGRPAEKLILAGVTGTNGKTTTAMLLEALLARRHGRAGFLGTVGYRTGRRELPADRTTPDATVVQALLAEMVSAGLPAAAVEASSHALALDRLEGCRFDVTVFTNLTRDHLDFHEDMESYFAAKRGLFSLRKPGACAVINTDDPYGARLAREVTAPVVTFSARGAAAGVRAEEIRCDLAGTRLEVAHASGRFAVASALLGRFNAENLLAASAAGLALSMSGVEIAEGLASVRRVPGRLEPVEAGQPYAILVDYAHTEDALRRLLQAVRELTDKRILLVFGCGGDRDRGKRAPMGRVAGELADIPIATSDNPRSEDPEKILDDIETGLRQAGSHEYLRIADRREAIRRALELAHSATVVVIAGKGHEATQVIGERKVPFDDRLVAAELASRKTEDGRRER
jgi:UDP-N-acetylmuramoyl-L-alanyl-D-glutamate--2,6-diaminopimelate ligase